jgi:hypothetical protein
MVLHLHGEPAAASGYDECMHIVVDLSCYVTLVAAVMVGV